MPSVSHNLNSTRELILTTNISQEPYAPVTCLKPAISNPNANLHKFLLHLTYKCFIYISDCTQK